MNDELMGRLAALEMVAAMGVYAFGYQQAASAAPAFLNDKLTRMKRSLSMGNDAMNTAAAAALDRIFHEATVARR